MRALTATALAASFFLSPLFRPAQQRGVVLAFRNVDVFDGSRMIRRTSVLVRGGMIRAVGPNVEVPPSAEVIDGEGKTLLPGFFDAHCLATFTAPQESNDPAVLSCTIIFDC